MAANDDAPITFLVTGANRGIGLELVRQILARGDHAIATYRSPERPASLRALAEAHGEALATLPLDVTDAASVTALAQTVETMLDERAIDVLVNNAGVYGGESQGVGDMDFAKWAHALDVNTLGPFRVTAALLPALRRSARPRVLTVSSAMGALTDGSGGHHAYRSSKAAVNKVMQTLAIDLRSDGVTVVPVHPGWVRTDMGGPDAPLSVEESARGLLALADRVTLAESGTFLDWSGAKVEW